ncbi:lysosomal alpha-glucosidase-like [Hyposmocoma kahamanoa]|uniref:lysosomal alpha-glucosidase-like n=1 Tax=Hyposmocoma kahamanoa TaxID=1477025 RepID=UPI000E6D9BFE|nr:lysosomal alpha-glucosidase-like [Hyposmocoma kahamanoa]
MRQVKESMERRAKRAPKGLDLSGAKQRGVEREEGGLCSAVGHALQEIRGKRPFIISRASYPGLGHYAGHWTGDILSTWEEMRMTIPAMLSFNLFGIPMVGADICGFGGRTTPELCKRWMQLGAFYPFSRNHADNQQPDHDPAAFTADVVEAVKKAYRIRYTLLPYYYTLFWRAHVDGETVARPLFFEYYGYDRLYPIDDQFLIGKHVMITPILKENATTTRPFFPGPHKFYNFVDGRFLASGDYYNVSDDEIVSVRSGAVIPLQQPAMSGPVTTTNCRSRPLQLIATPVQILWQDNVAKGELYWDDGDSLNSYEEKKYSHIEFTLKDNELQSYVKWWGYGVPSVNNITIFGLKPIESVTLNNRNVDFIYKYHTQVLTVENLNLSLDKPFKLTWHYPVAEDDKDEDDEKYNKQHSKTVDCVNNEKPCTIND